MCRETAIRAFCERHHHALVTACAHAFIFGRDPSLRRTHVIQIHLRRLGAADALRLDRVFDVEDVLLPRREDARVRGLRVPANDLGDSYDGYTILIDEFDANLRSITVYFGIRTDAEYERTALWLDVAPEDGWPEILRQRLQVPTHEPPHSSRRMALALGDAPPFQVPEGSRLMTGPNGRVQLKQKPDWLVCVSDAARPY